MFQATNTSLHIISEVASPSRYSRKHSKSNTFCHIKASFQIKYRMTEELGNEIQGMFRSIYDAADLKYMRPIKRHMFKCGYDCLDAKNTTKQAEECINECGRPIHLAMETMQAEINTFQGRLDRCLMNCQDDVRNEKEEATAKRIFEGCAEKCVKSFVPAVPGVIKTLCEKLDKIKKDYKIS